MSRDTDMPLLSYGTVVDGYRITVGFHRRSTLGRNFRELEKKPRLYVDTGEAVLEDFVNRTSRPHQVWRPLIKQALARAGMDDVKINWNQRAGCTCPCSPGFIMTGAHKLDASWLMDDGDPHVFDNGYRSDRYDVWVEIDGAPTVHEDAVTDERRARRLDALVNDPTIPVEVVPTA